MNTRFLDALLKKPVDRTPIWIMRQAGRYLPEYREVRKTIPDFMTLCKTPELACEVTMQPLRRFDLDAAILFSDILTIPDAMGLGLQFVAGEGPQFAHPLRDANAIAKLGVPDPESELGYVMDAIRAIKTALNDTLPLIGFSGSPWTLATYMVEGKSSKDFKTVRGFLYEAPQMMHQLLDVLAQSVSAYLSAQIAAGVNAVMIFDTWGGILSHQHYPEFSLRYMQQILESLPSENANGDTIPKIIFTKNGGQWLEKMAATGAHALGLDWTTDIANARARVGDQVALQGNLDPACLRANPEVIRDNVAQILTGFGSGSGHVFNLGHGITPDINPEHVSALVDAVHEMSEPYHR